MNGHIKSILETRDLCVEQKRLMARPTRWRLCRTSPFGPVVVPYSHQKLQNTHLHGINLSLIDSSLVYHAKHILQQQPKSSNTWRRQHYLQWWTFTRPPQYASLPCACRGNIILKIVKASVSLPPKYGEQMLIMKRWNEVWVCIM